MAGRVSVRRPKSHDIKQHPSRSKTRIKHTSSTTQHGSLNPPRQSDRTGRSKLPCRFGFSTSGEPSRPRGSGQMRRCARFQTRGAQGHAHSITAAEKSFAIGDACSVRRRKQSPHRWLRSFCFVAGSLSRRKSDESTVEQPQPRTRSRLDEKILQLSYETGSPLSSSPTCLWWTDLGLSCDGPVLGVGTVQEVFIFGRHRSKVEH